MSLLVIKLTNKKMENNEKAQQNTEEEKFLHRWKIKALLSGFRNEVFIKLRIIIYLLIFILLALVYIAIK